MWDAIEVKVTVPFVEWTKHETVPKMIQTLLIIFSWLAMDHVFKTKPELQKNRDSRILSIRLPENSTQENSTQNTQHKKTQHKTTHV